METTIDTNSDLTIRFECFSCQTSTKLRLEKQVNAAVLARRADHKSPLNEMGRTQSLCLARFMVWKLCNMS